MNAILIDTDVGTDVDDALALALAACWAAVDLRAVTTVTTNPRLRARLARKLMLLAGRPDVAVAAGCGPTLLRTKPGLSLGHEGQGILENSEDGQDFHPEHAVDLIVDTLRNSPTKPTLVCMGPLTNVALAIIKEPFIVERLERVILVGGCLSAERMGGGEFDIPEQVAHMLEHNLNSDGEAAQVVWEAGLPLLLVPTDLTYRLWFDEAEVALIGSGSSPLRQALHAACEIWLPIFRGLTGGIGLPETFARAYLHDPFAVALAGNPALAQTRPAQVMLQSLDGQLRTREIAGGPPNMEIVTALDAPMAKDLILRCLTGTCDAADEGMG
ncbi:MAG: nucleoside hydrolase [Anaerolineales bacterium]|nr:nucleoside hydrolase [Anaerolineales bacterium]